MTKKKVANKVGRPKKPIVADSVVVAPRQLGFLERIWVWLKDRVK